MSKNSVQQALFCFSENNPPDKMVEKVIFPILLLYPLPISTHPKLPAQSVKVIFSGASSSLASLPPPLPFIPL